MSQDNIKREKFTVLKEEVYSFLNKNQVSVKRPKTQFFKAFLLWGLWAASYVLYLTFGPDSLALAIGFTLAWTTFMLIIQLAVMHDASHGASSDYTWTNKLLSASISFLGGSAILWKHQHCIAHHNNTNVHNRDHDINTNGILRLHPSQSREEVHRNQHVYAWLLYPLFVLSWIWWGDLRDVLYNTYSLDKKKMNQAIAECIVIKIWHVAMFLVLPILIFQSFWVPVVCYLLSFSLMGFFMVVIFQLAHVTEVQKMPNIGELDREGWVVKQVSTTTNFAMKNKILSWCTGGLNYQIEHHLFPGMSHLNYPLIQPIVEKFCKRNAIPYHSHKTVFDAVSAHQKHLVFFGRDSLRA